MTFFFETFIFKAQTYAFAPFHRPENSTCRTAGYTPLQYIILPKYNMNNKSRSLATPDI